MKTKRELEKELERCSYRYKSLSDISNRREMESHEEEELEVLEIRVNDLKKMLEEKNTNIKKKFISVGKYITVFAGVLFLMLTIYSSTSAYHFMQSETSIEKQIIMALTTFITFALTMGSAMMVKKQFTIR
ncbi:hypothetical protein QQ008_10325 [Fulvivirgaceae bacterium BMA10]|uniref:Uncharacterized protein n=1 Tax=Splendidivirga corallicola TaxID=3051826 RepID=A0ABT8KM13_9BACT|nr:hypothetical protein [Fulvivirgaceae bacterium BMA10]